MLRLADNCVRLTDACGRSLELCATWRPPMPYYRSVGEIPPKRHTQFRQPDGGLYAEELMGQEGFSSDSSLLYHRYLPTAIVAAEEYQPNPWTRSANLPLKPRHLQTHKLDTTGADPV